MAKKTRSGVWRCKSGFVGPVGARKRVAVPAGALVPHEFPYEVMDDREGLFEDVSAPCGEVEQATAAPGEKRSVRRSKPKPEVEGDEG